jgi:predicted DNA-binding protein
MATRTVRLDPATESTLQALRERTGLSISEVLKRGIEAYAASTRDEVSLTPYEVFRRLDLGRGGCSLSEARHAKAAIASAFRKKHQR